MKTKGGSYPGERPCAHPDCSANGEYRAPTRRPGSVLVGPSGPPEWQYLCLDHVRAFNAGWNYFEGLSDEEVWQQQTPYPHWDRETRAFAFNAFGDGPDRVTDALGVLRWRTAAGAKAKGPVASREDRQALAKLGLDESASLEDVKATYRKLARRYHPDLNDGRRDHEAKLQALTEAHRHLVASPFFTTRRGGG